MRERCLNPNCPEWKWYGAKGVTICQRWDVFKNFLDDMGSRPMGKTLDRIDACGNYEPKNCRWATHTEQVRNSRRALLVNVGDRRIPLKDACEELGVTFAQVYWRMKQRGVPIDDALAMAHAAKEAA